MTGELERRTPLRSKKPLTSKSNLRSTARLQRTRKLRAKSAKRRQQERDENRNTVRRAVFARDGRCMLADLPGAGRCFGPPTFSHRRKEGQQGAYTEANGVQACAHHNQLLEADAAFAKAARERGFVVRPGDPNYDDLGR